MYLNLQGCLLVVPNWWLNIIDFLSGEGGKPVVIKKEELPPVEREKFEEGEKNNAFNEYASNMISVRRYLPDIREPQ